MSARLDRIADGFDADDVEPERDAEFEPCRSCPWPGACRNRGGCEADD